ncbi:MAG: hypothetical protein U0903_04010 [Planctomycetales bacterium]
MPTRGLESGTLSEWLAAEGSLAGILSLFTLRGVLAAPGTYAALIDGQGEISPLACAGWGVDLNRLLLIQPASHQETWWAVEQCLRSKAIQAVWGQLQDVPERVFRRWLLAAEAGGGVGIFLRPERVRRTPTWSHIRWAVHLVPGAGIAGHRLEIELLACRHGTSGQRVLVDLDHATSSVRVVSELERAASPVAATGS